jgi:two-component system response regulator PilR (NtrC family)
MAPGGARPVVLVVDDEPSIRLLCKVNLELGGYEVLEAGTLAEARERLARGVDVVLLDMHIGTERGDSLLAELKERGTPVIVVTGSTDVAPVARVADAVLPKPFTIDALEDAVARLSARRM